MCSDELPKYTRNASNMAFMRNKLSKMAREMSNQLKKLAAKLVSKMTLIVIEFKQIPNEEIKLHTKPSNHHE